MLCCANHPRTRNRNVILQRASPIVKRTTWCTICQDKPPAVQLRLSAAHILNLCPHCYRDLAYLITHWTGVQPLTTTGRPPDGSPGSSPAPRP